MSLARLISALALCSCVARIPGLMIPSPSGKWEPFTSPQKHLKSWPKGLLVLLLGLCVQGRGGDSSLWAVLKHWAVLGGLLSV